MLSHQPVLCREIVDTLLGDHLNEDSQGWIADLTLGGGGHTQALIDEIQRRSLSAVRVMACDRDLEAVERARARFRTELDEGILEIRQGSFSDFHGLVEGRALLGFVADLGVSSFQLDDPRRGFSFQSEGPLDMRMDQSQGISVKDWLSEASEEEIREVLRDYGQERFAQRIARRIVYFREKDGIPETTTELASLIRGAFPRPRQKKGSPRRQRGGIDLATRSFQAFRIRVNSEMEELDSLLRDAILALCIGGRGAVISFHSLEDRKVKRALKQIETVSPLERKPIIPQKEEMKSNRRARSAKLRVFEKID